MGTLKPSHKSVQYATVLVCPLHFSVRPYPAYIPYGWKIWRVENFVQSGINSTFHVYNFRVMSGSHPQKREIKNTSKFSTCTVYVHAQLAHYLVLN